MGGRLVDAVNREAWDEVAQVIAPYVSVESRRKIVGFPRMDVPAGQWPEDMRRYLETGMVRYRHSALAVRGERLALIRLEIGTADLSSGAPQDEMLQVVGIDKEGRIALQVKFDVEDIDAAFAELDAAYARIERAYSKAPLENAASRVYDRVQVLFGARDVSPMRELFSNDISSEDRRPTVNAGTRRGREAVVDDARANAALGVKEVTSEIVATRGERLVLRSARYSGNAQRADSFHVDVLNVIEIDADEKIAALITFEPGDFDAAFAELDRRYLAGEASDHAHAWSVIMEVYAALNRRELPATKPDWVNIDHRRGTSIAPGEMHAVLSAAWNSTSDLTNRVVTVHRLSDLGAVISHTAHEISEEGFRAEWRVVSVVTVDGDMVNRCEVFDEADLEAAIERFDQLSHPSPRLENAASQVAERFLGYFASQQWDAMADMLADGFYGDDRRPVVGSGVRSGRDAQIADLQAIAELWSAEAMSTVIATRGRCLALMCLEFLGGDPGLEAFVTEVLCIVEVNSSGQTAAWVVFGPDDLEAAFAELDARHVAGEAADHAHTWSVVTECCAALNRRELPATTPDWVNVDHRRVISIAPGDMNAMLSATWDSMSDLNNRIVTIHRLNDRRSRRYAGCPTRRRSRASAPSGD